VRRRATLIATHFQAHAYEVHVATKTAAGLEPIDRLEEKIKTLVSLIGRLKNEQARIADENARLQRDMEALKARLADAEGSSVEAVALREERDLIKARVAEMLQQLDGLNL
jgi:regulator of replication initiation timing